MVARDLQLLSNCYWNALKISWRCRLLVLTRQPWRWTLPLISPPVTRPGAQEEEEVDNRTLLAEEEPRTASRGRQSSCQRRHAHRLHDPPIFERNRFFFQCNFHHPICDCSSNLCRATCVCTDVLDEYRRLAARLVFFRPDLARRGRRCFGSTELKCEINFNSPRSQIENLQVLQG